MKPPFLVRIGRPEDIEGYMFVSSYTFEPTFEPLKAVRFDDLVDATKESKLHTWGHVVSAEAPHGPHPHCTTNIFVVVEAHLSRNLRRAAGVGVLHVGTDRRFAEELFDQAVRMAEADEDEDAPTRICLEVHPVRTGEPDVRFAPLELIPEMVRGWVRKVEALQDPNPCVDTRILNR